MRLPFPISSLKVLEWLIFSYWKKKSRRKSSLRRPLSFFSLVILLFLNSIIIIPSVSCQDGAGIGSSEDQTLAPDALHPLQPQLSPGNRWSRSDARARLLASLPRQPRHRGECHEMYAVKRHEWRDEDTGVLGIETLHD